MKLKFVEVIAAVLLIVALAPSAFSQTLAPVPQEPRPRDFAPLGIFAFEGPMEGLDAKIVTGAPFSAQVATEHLQTLSDGNRIDRKSQGTLARDSAGRLRREMALPNLGPLVVAGEAPHIVSIIDPVAGQRYFLDENKKTANAAAFPPKGRLGEKQMAELAFPGDSNQATKLSAPDRYGQLKTEPLGRKTIEGITVEGTRTTRTIPANSIGNENPITIIVERWYSPDLQVNVLVKRSNPLFGEMTYQLTNISREEPAAALFAVPADYTVKEGRARPGELEALPKPDQD